MEVKIMEKDDLIEDKNYFNGNQSNDICDSKKVGKKQKKNKQ